MFKRNSFPLLYYLFPGANKQKGELVLMVTNHTTLRTLDRKECDLTTHSIYMVNSITLRAQRLINFEIPVLVRSLRLSNVELGYYCSSVV